ncbi:MAG TPA: efflux RND transporter permease subunit, partial [Clostridia bacterium]
MSITEISVKRPATIIIVMLLLIGLGILGYTSMGADMLPSMNVPVITISVSYNGASAEEIKKDVVKPLEDAVSGISGIDTIQSTAREGRGMVSITFTMETNMNSALLDVQGAVDRAQRSLPTDASKPVIYKVDLNAQSVMTLTVSGSIPYDELYHIANDIQQNLENLPNIGQVSLQGANDKQLSIKLDKAAVEYYNINLNTLMSKITSENTNAPAGNIVQDKSDITVRMVGEFKDINEVKNLLVPTGNGGTVRLEDIATVAFTYPDNDTVIKLNGKNAIGISIQKQSDSNVVEAVNGVKAELDKIRKTLPKGVVLTVADDSTTSINASLTEIKHNLVEGIITTAIVLLLFLRSWRSSLIILLAIPTSLISTFFMMYEFHFTLNMMSLMALSLCVGILVDDSIVVIENIQRHLGMGKNPVTAAIEGRSEIGMAAIAITLCDIVVFAPVAFMSGMTGQIFKEFGLTVSFAALFSLFVSFTVTPMLASRISKREVKKENSPKKETKFSKFFDGATGLYKRFLIWSLDNRWKIVSVLTAGVVASIALLPLGYIKSEFIPQTDNNKLQVNLSLNPGSSLQLTEDKINIVENYLKTVPEITSYFTQVGGTDKSSANITLRLVD